MFVSARRDRQARGATSVAALASDGSAVPRAIVAGNAVSVAVDNTPRPSQQTALLPTVARESPPPPILSNCRSMSSSRSFTPASSSLPVAISNVGCSTSNPNPKPSSSALTTTSSVAADAAASSITAAQATPTKQPTTLTNSARGNVRQEIKLQAHQKTVHELAAQGELLLRDLDADPRLVDALDNQQLTPLIYAAYYGQWPTVESLLVRRAAIDYSLPSTGQTALMFAAANDHQHCVKTLLRFGANINKTDHNGNSALHYAAQNNCANVVRQLLANGADMYCKNKDGFIPYNVSVEVGSQSALDEMNQFLRKTMLEKI